jgi:hypothetical protein
MVVAVVFLAAGVLLSRTLGEPGQAAPLGPAPQAPTSGHQVWSGRMQGGVVPVGWAHSQDGAIAAATTYTVLLSSKLLFDPSKRRLAVDVIAAPEARARLQAELEATASTVAASLLGETPQNGARQVLDSDKLVFQAIPVRYRVEAYDGTRARIAILMTGLGGYQDSPVPVQEAWGVTTVELRWIQADWKETGATLTDGPVPTADEPSTSAASALAGEVQRFQEYPLAPGR